MLHEVAADVDMDADVDAADLVAAYESLLTDAVDGIDPARIAAETPIDESVAEAIVADRLDGDAGDLTIEQAAAVLALGTDRDADAIVFELRDHLLMGMTTAVLDVDTIAGAIEADLTGQELQQLLEGRAPMTLAQLAEIQQVLLERQH